jgi:hypothetical protein
LERGFSFLGFVFLLVGRRFFVSVFCFGVRRRWFCFPFPATVVVLFAFYASVLVLVGGVSVSGDGGGFVLLPGRALWFCLPFLFGVRICCAKLLDALDFGIWCWILV